MSSMLLFSFLLLRNLFSNDRCCSVFLLVFSFSCCSMNSGKREAISKRMSKLKVGGKIRDFFLTCEKKSSAISDWSDDFFSHVRKVISITQCAVDEFYLGNCRREHSSKPFLKSSFPAISL